MQTPLHREDELAERAIGVLRKAQDALSGCRIYGLIDPALADPLAEAIGETPTISAPERLNIAVSIIARDRQPYLIEIANDLQGDRLLSASVRIAVRERLGHYDSEAGEVRSICGWLFADQAGIDSRFARAVWVRSPVDNERTVFRFWDPRLVSHMPRIFGADNWAATISGLGLRAWWYLDEEGTAHGFQSASGMAADEIPPEWAMDEDRWFALARIGWTNRAWRMLPHWEVSKGVSRETLRAVVERTWRYRMRDERDVLRFVNGVLTLHPRFDLHPQVAALLADIQAGRCRPGGFADAAQQWDDEFRGVLREGRWLKEPATETGRNHE